ncbi:MAG: hypothetical protein EXS36_13975 [Pedosphaera sp.]|nr:hypothetical protein [Pedosphaera sp.]
MNPNVPPILALLTISEILSGRVSLPPVVWLAGLGLFVVLGSILAWTVTKMLIKLTLVLVVLLAIAGAAWWNFARPQ